MMNSHSLFCLTVGPLLATSIGFSQTTRPTTQPAEPSPQPAATQPQDDNPAAPGFNTADSDAEAIALADRVMAKMGGRDAWDQTRFISWTFFDRRTYIWDKHEQRVRIEFTGPRTARKYVAVLELDDHTQTTIWNPQGEPVTDPEEFASISRRLQEWFINDSYWLVMPYKLKDTGVTLKMHGTGETLAGEPASIIRMTFANVGVTPENMYDIYIADESGLVEQWDFYPTADAVEPQFQMPWRNWQMHGDIALSDMRRPADSDEPEILSDVAVITDIADTELKSPTLIDMDELPRAAVREM